MPDTPDHKRRLLSKDDYQTLVSLSSRGALLCEFLDNSDIMEIQAAEATRYAVELSCIEAEIGGIALGNR